MIESGCRVLGPLGEGTVEYVVPLSPTCLVSWDLNPTKILKHRRSDLVRVETPGRTTLDAFRMFLNQAQD